MMNNSDVDYALSRALVLAKRSSLQTNQTGAIVTTKNCVILGEGWSHYCEPTQSRYPKYRSVHAELHALVRTRSFDGPRHTMFVAMRRRKSGTIGVAKPCGLCEQLLIDAGISEVYYTVGLTNSGRINWKGYMIQ